MILSVIGALYVFAVIFGFAFAPSIVKQVAIKNLSEALGRPVSVEEITLNPLELSATIRGFRIGEPTGDQAFVSFKELYVNLESSSIVRRGPVVREFKLVSPSARIERTADNIYNFSDLIAPDRSKERDAEPSEPLHFSINNIQITGGRVELLDVPKKARHEVQDINISLPFISNLESQVESFIQPHFSAVVNGSPVMVKGRSKPFVDTIETSMDIDMLGIDIPEYIKYSPVEPPLTIRSGKLGINCQVSFLQKNGDRPRISVTGLITLRDLIAETKDGSPLTALPFINVRISSASVFERIFRLSEISVAGPTLNVVRNRDGRFNLSSIVPSRDDGVNTETPDSDASASDGTSSKADGPAFPVTLSVDTINLSNASIRYLDSTFPTPYQTSVTPINLTVRNFSTERDRVGSFEFSATKDEDEFIGAQGSLSLDPVVSEGKFAVTDIALARLLPIYSSLAAFIVDQGKFGIKGGYSYVKERDEEPATVSGIEVRLDGLKLRAPDEKLPFLSIDHFAILNASANPGPRTVMLGEVQTSGGALDITRLKDGSISIMRLIASSHVKKTGKTLPPAPASQLQKNPWLVDMGLLNLSRYSVSLTDMTPPAEPFRLSVREIAFTLKNFSTDPKRPANLSFSALIPKRGSVSVNGTIAIDPVRVNLSARVRDLGVWLVEPYMRDKFNIIISDGYLDAAGKIRFNAKTGETEIRGNAAIKKLLTLDSEQYEEVLGWQNLTLKDILATRKPDAVEIGSIELDGLNAAIWVSADKSTNISRLLKAKSGKTPATTGQTAPQPVQTNGQQSIKIGDIILKDGSIRISDRSVSVPYSSALEKIEGKITGISSIAKEPAGISLKGIWDGHAPLDISGTLRPFKENTSADISLKFDNMDLSTLTPYSGTFAGLVISKGKLFIDTTTKIDGTALSSSNKLTIDQFEFGDNVESDRAMKLPFKLAVALLKNRKGEISLDLPVSGHTDDPDFSYGGIIIDIIVNLVAKAATSPFSLIASAFGSEELSNIAFEAGSYAIPPSGIKKIASMAEALYDRPALKIEVRGYAGGEADEVGLRNYIFNRKLRIAKHRELVDRGTRDITVDSVAVAPEEMPKYLALAYKAESFKKQRNILGFAKTLPDAEMEKLIRDNIVITNEDLRDLASRRAREVIAALTATGKVEPERIFLIEGESNAPKPDEKIPPASVEFSLK